MSHASQTSKAAGVTCRTPASVQSIGPQTPESSCSATMNRTSGTGVPARGRMAAAAVFRSTRDFTREVG